MVQFLFHSIFWENYPSGTRNDPQKKLEYHFYDKGHSERSRIKSLSVMFELFDLLGHVRGQNGGFLLLVTRGVVIMATPSYHAKMKLQMHVRGQNGGFLGCPIHLAYCQMSSTCISRVFTCLLTYLTLRNVWGVKVDLLLWIWNMIKLYLLSTIYIHYLNLNISMIIWNVTQHLLPTVNSLIILLWLYHWIWSIRFVL